jgi:hypothetical protein
MTIDGGPGRRLEFAAKELVKPIGGGVEKHDSYRW